MILDFNLSTEIAFDTLKLLCENTYSAEITYKDGDRELTLKDVELLKTEETPNTLTVIDSLVGSIAIPVADIIKVTL